MKKILLIEDDEILRENTAIFLKLKKFEVLTAGDGPEGIELAVKEQPDMIICDITMPKMSGYEVLENIRKNPDTSIIPFIFLTAKAEKDDYRKGLQLGVDDYISKPFSYNELLSAIELRLSKAENVIRTVTSRYLSYNFDDATIAKIADSVNHSSASSRLLRKLSEREKEILRMIADGFTTTEIGEKLFISPRTVEFHRANLLSKTESKNVADLIKFALQNHIAEF